MKPGKNVIPITRDNSPMTSNTPEPMTPPDSDLTGFEWMELNIHRLFRSELWAKASGDEFRAALKLWGESFWEKPAGSLPDDDVLLARLADYGRDVKGFEAVKGMVMRGWVKCSDGRLYHPVVAETVNRAWTERIEFRQKNDSANERKKAERERRSQMFKTLAAHGVQPAWNVTTSELSKLINNLSQTSHSDKPVTVTAKTETETETETGNNIFINTEANSETSDPKSTGKKPPSAKKQKTTLPPDFDISPQVQAWAESNGHTQLPARLENFRLAAERNGYQYADWDAAFKTAIRDDWAKLSLQAPADSASSQTRGGIHSGFDKIDYTRGIGPNGEF